MKKLPFGIGIIMLLNPLFLGDTEAIFMGKRPPLNYTKASANREVVINNRQKVTNRSYYKTWEPARGSKLTPTARHTYGLTRVRPSARTVRPEVEELKKFSLETEKPIKRSTDRYSGISSKEYLRGDRRLERISHKEKQRIFLQRKLNSSDRFELSE